MGNLEEYNLNDVPAEEQKPVDLVPAGWYDAVIVESEVKPNSKGTGKLLALTWQVLSGSHKNARLKNSLNIKHNDQQTAEIAKRELGYIRHATGVSTPNDSTELHNKPCSINVVVREYTRKDGTVGHTNDIKAYGKRGKFNRPAASTTAPAPVNNTTATSTAATEPEKIRQASPF